MRRAEAAFVDWRSAPAPRRGEIVWQIGQEVIDTCDHAASRVDLQDLKEVLDVNVRTGSVDGTALQGSVRVSARSGSVRLERVVGDLDARALSGSVSPGGS